MSQYIIKTLTRYLIECDTDQEALDCYNDGLYDQADLEEETSIELGKYDSNDDYIVIRSN